MLFRSERARIKLFALMTDFLDENGPYQEEVLKSLSECIGVPVKILSFLTIDPEKVSISADLIERLSCPLNVSMSQLLSKPVLTEENRKAFRKYMKKDGFSIGLHMGEEDQFDLEALYAYLTALDAINVLVSEEENVFLNDYT